LAPSRRLYGECRWHYFGNPPKHPFLQGKPLNADAPGGLEESLRSHRDLSGRSFYAGLLEALIQVMGTWNGYLFHHGPRVSCTSLRLAKSFGFSEEEEASLFFGAVLSDVGMIGMVEEAWENPKPSLSPDARAEVNGHPVRSAETVRAVPYLDSVSDLVVSHHEWWDGSGYPNNLQGADIPLGAQILRLSDTVAALGEVRPHRGPLPSAEIRKIVRRGSGIEFSPEVVKKFFTLMDQGEVGVFNPQFFQNSLLKSLDVFIPNEVSQVSADQLLELFAGLVDAKDPYTGGHSRRVAALARAVAEKMNLPEEVQEQTWAAGFLHDMGKVSVPLRILTKSGRLSPDEFRRIQSHSTVGARITSSIPSLQHLATGCRYHHGRWDGSGYPEGISGSRIPVLAQILAVVDSYDAMTSGRAYRTSRSHGHAMEEVDRGSGVHFAPRAAGAFLTLPYETFREIKKAEAPRPHGPVAPFTERFHRLQRAVRVAG
jgi:HD-GYP domain-containing protein (c-di-GMP phosphodiesterase class II)